MERKGKEKNIMIKPMIHIVTCVIMMLGYCFQAFAIDSEKDHSLSNKTKVQQVECAIPGLTVGKMFGIDRALVEDIVRSKN
jgi:hypothetical protein